MEALYVFLAQTPVTAEQAAKALADQTYNQPVNWWLAFITTLVTIAGVILIVRAFKKSDITEDLLRKANEDRLSVAVDYKVLSARILEYLERIEEVAVATKEEIMKFIYRSGGGK